MNKKDKNNNMEMSWAFVIIGSTLGFMINILASSTFEMYINDYNNRVLFLFISSLIGTIFFIDFFSCVIKNKEEIKKMLAFGRPYYSILEADLKKINEKYTSNRKI